MTNSDFSCVETRFFFGSRHCVAVLQTQVPKLYTDLDLSLLYILILGTYRKFAQKNNFLALGVCFPQPWSSAARRSCVKITFTVLPPNRFVSTTKNSMKCVVNWIGEWVILFSENFEGMGMGMGMGMDNFTRKVYFWNH